MSRAYQQPRSRKAVPDVNPAQQALYMTFSASYRDLDETDALFLRQMCWIPQEFRDANGHMDTRLAAAASGKSPAQGRDALERLTALFLLNRSGDDEFRLHGSHEEFIRCLASEAMQEREREDVLARLRAWRCREDGR